MPPSLLSSTVEGYQAVGTRPTVLPPATLITATAFSPALAAKRVWPSVLIASETGLELSGALLYGETEIVLVTV